MRKNILMFFIMCMFPALNLKAENKTLAEVRRELYGEDLSSPSKESLIGQYVAKTQSSVLVRKFPNAPEGSTVPPFQLGPQKLTVALSPTTFSDFLKYFSSKHYFFVVHTPNSGTFHFGFKGQAGSYAKATDPFLFEVAGSLVIPVLMDSLEGARMEKFFELGNNDSTQDLAANPWNLKGPQGPYSATSAFQGCTHWVGQIPIGTERVASYLFPSGDEDGSHPNQQVLNEYDVTNLNLPAQTQSIVHETWKVPGHQLMGEVLAPAAYRRGEFTNVGWVTYTALGSLGIDRVPVVFYMVNDEKEPIPLDFPLSISPSRCR